jgi:hypothetical protein
LQRKARFLRRFLNGKRRHISYAPGSAVVQTPFASGKKSGISLKFCGEFEATLLNRLLVQEFVP